MARSKAYATNKIENIVVPWYPPSLIQILFSLFFAKLGVANGTILIIILFI
jgi:hypothetical protein